MKTGIRTVPGNVSSSDVMMAKNRYLVRYDLATLNNYMRPRSFSGNITKMIAWSLPQGGNITSVSFCYWLQGLFELANPQTLTADQTQMIKNHLNLVFLHEIDPAIEATSKVPKVELDATHSPKGGYFHDSAPTVMRC